MEPAPGEQAPGEQAPGEQAPGEQAPGEQAPGEQAPGEQARARASAPGCPRRASRWLPGSSVIRSSPVTKAFGGQVIGSTASARLRCGASSASPVEYLQPAVAVARPQRDLLARRAEPGPGQAVGVCVEPVNAWSRRVPPIARAARKFLRRAGDILRCRGRYPAGVRRQPLAAGRASSHSSMAGVPRAQVRMRPGCRRAPGRVPALRAVMLTCSPPSALSR